MIFGRHSTAAHLQTMLEELQLQSTAFIRNVIGKVIRKARAKNVLVNLGKKTLEEVKNATTSE